MFVAFAAGQDFERGRLVRVEVVGVPRGIDAGVGLGVGDTVGEEGLEHARLVLEQRLIEEGYLSPRVRLETAPDQSGVVAQYLVEPGVRARVAGWRVVGDDTIGGRPARQYLPARGAVFSRRNLELAAKKLLAALERNGYPLAEVVAAGVADSAGWVVPVFSAKAGHRIVVDRLEFRAAGGTSRRTLARLARFAPGRVYSPALVRFWKTELERSGAVRVIGHEIVPSPAAAVRFSVEPARSSRVMAAIGYETERRAFTGFAELDLRNLLNTGRSAQAGWRAFPQRSSWSLRYVEPWVFVSWLTLGAGARHEVYDTSAAYTSLAVRADITPGPGPALELSAGYDFTAAADTLIGASRTTWAGTGLRIDTREPATMASSGSFLVARTSAGNRAGRSGTGFVGRFELDAGALGPSVGRILLSSAVHYRIVYSRLTLSEPEQYRMGGARGLRGYREEEFSGAQLGWVNCELNVSLGRNAAGYPFVDAGVCEGETGWRTGLGYGIGMRAVTAVGTIEAAYGVAYRDSPLRGKMHLGLEAGF